MVRHDCVHAWRLLNDSSACDIVFTHKGKYSLENVLTFLEQRVGLLDGVVLSGGEATSHNLISFCQKIKSLGFKIKLDTNGTNYNNTRP